MSTPEALPYRPRSVPLGRRVAARLVVGCAHALAALPPGRIRAVLGLLRREPGPRRSRRRPGRGRRCSR